MIRNDSPALGTPFAQGHDDHLQEEQRDVDVLRLHEGLPPRLSLVHSLGSGQVDLRACSWSFNAVSFDSGADLRVLPHSAAT